MHRPAIDIYAGDMLAVTHSLLEDLPKVFRTTACSVRSKWRSARWTSRTDAAASRPPWNIVDAR
jgi:hypothetical protein